MFRRRFLLLYTQGMRTVVGVLRGGPSGEYEVSLKSGASVLEHLDRDKYEPRDIFISRDGEWHVHGVAMDPEKALKGVDVAFNAMHGEYGEDGRVQRQLDALGVPYTGSNAFSSSIAFNKQHTKEAVQKLGVKVAHGLVLEPAKEGEIDALARRLFRSFPHPAIIKPVSSGSSVGTHVAHNYHALEHALARAAAVSPRILIEEFIPGREATVGVVDDFRNERTYALMPVEIVPPPHQPFFNYEAKYSGETTERVPGNFTDKEKGELEQIAKTVHEGLNLSHYSRSDFIISKRGIYFLEVNTLPGLTSESLLPKALKAVGSSLSAFLDHVISLARAPRKA
ncbi:MAG: D-alanine--D-alanine ligase [Candidatus Adlerbacteria bacterium]|nr:D-alanine--D-alanine ligase [Candidatus Adlerbacteria bacterium]